MLKVENLSVGEGNYRLDGVSFEIELGKCAVLMGKSGSGKTMVMEAICGLRSVNEGVITIADREVTYEAPGQRGVGLVPQDNVLFSKMSVKEQIAYGPKLRKWRKDLVEERVEEVAEQLKIEHLLGRSSKMLSGGEAKRVAIARAIAPKPRLLCLDESFTGLDSEIRVEVMEVLAKTIEAEQMTSLLITHHVTEAEKLAQIHYELLNGAVKLR